MSQTVKPTAESTSGKEHPKAKSFAWALIVLIICAILSFSFFLFAIPFGLITILSIDVAKTLIEAIATLLGFFGLIAIYLLTSYDNRIDKLEERIQDSNDTEKIERFRTIQQSIKTRKQNATISIITALSCLIISLFLSIFALGLLSVNTEQALALAWWATLISYVLLFIGAFSIPVMVYKIGKEPE